ncbi:unnamed protein product [Sympodiomycopsis kandeliae]
MTTTTMSRIQRAYRSVLFQVIIVGIVGFSQPGIWTALSSLGAAGQAKPFLINAANSATFGIMTIGCALSGGLANKIGSKWTLLLGVIFYTPYASSLYCNNRFGTEWYVIFGAVLCGIGASMFWASEGAIAVGYPSEDQRGKMVATWMAIRNLAPLTGGAISLSLNVKSGKAGRVSDSTYLTFIGLQCIGVPAVLLLSPAHKVLRPNGSHPPSVNRKDVTLKSELKAIWSAATRPHMLLLIPIFVVGIWGSVYQSNYLTTYFSVRSRALVSLLTAIMGLTANAFIGLVVDSKKLGANQAKRAKYTWIFVGFLTTSLWIWQTITQVHFTRNSDPVDWADSSRGRFNNSIAVFALWKFAYECQLCFLYWLVGTFPYEAGGIERAMGVLRTFESLGSTFSFAVGATHWPNLNQGVLAFALWMTCLIPTTLAIAKVPENRTQAVKELEQDLGVAQQDNAQTSSGAQTPFDDDEKESRSREGSEKNVPVLTA